jgi:hypothetical protein
MEQAQTPWQRFGDPDRKRKYAALARVRPDTVEGRYEAACLTFPDAVDDNLARMAAEQYRYDRVVIEELARLAKVEPEADLPSKAEQARDIYNLTKGATSIDDKIKAHKLYAELMGFVQKPSAAPAGGVSIHNRIMVMPAAPTSIDDWEAVATSQQARLVNNASR